MAEQRGGQFTEIEEQYSGYTVYDRDGDKIGKVDDLFVDENDRPEYLGVKMGLFGLSGTTLIPWEAVRVDEGDRRIEVQAEKETVKNGPSFDDDDQITPEYEEQVRSHYGLGGRQEEGTAQRGAYGGYYQDQEREGAEARGGERREGEREGDRGHVGPGMREGDIEDGEFRGHPEDDEGVNQSRGDDLEDRDELRVQRSEEELVASTREREAGRMNVRKRVRTDREQVRVPTQREEVHVERVQVNEEASEAEIGEDEVSVPVVEEEAVVDKRAVVKEEVRLRKDVVEEEQVVEEDVRKEEVDIEDSTERGQGLGDDAGRRDR